MGLLSSEITQVSGRAFTMVGLDFARPFTLQGAGSGLRAPVRRFGLHVPSDLGCPLRGLHRSNHLFHRHGFDSLHLHQRGPKSHLQ